MTAEQRILAWLERADFDGTGCRHSQATIGKGVGCSRETVNRLTQKLAREDRIDSWMERRPGCKWPCRVYRVKHWNPHKRTGVLNVLASLKERREAECHTERTAAPSRAHTTSQATTPGRCSGRTSAVVARPRCQLCGFEIRRTGMADPLRLPVTCEECARKDRIIRQYAENHSKLVDEVSGAQETARAAGKEITTLKRRITRQANEDAEAEQIERLLEFWRQSHPKAQTPPGGRRWEVCKRALKLMKDDPAGPVTACLEALEGIRLFPFMLRAQRTSELAPGAKRYDDVEHALGDEVRIGKARLLAAWAKADKAERCWTRYQWAQVCADYWQGLTMEGLEERRRVPVAEAVARMEQVFEDNDGRAA